MAKEDKTVKIFSDSPSPMPERPDSRIVYNIVGSGSRPTKSKIDIETSAPEDAHTQGRDVPGSLK